MISMISSFTIRCSRWLGNTAATRRYLFTFEILHQSKKSNARVGRIQTDHGPIDTPGFVPVGTMGALKGMDQAQADAADVQLMFANTYHLLLQPGMDIIQEAGGLHRFMKRTKPLITDSGGFQVFSLAHGSIHDELKRNKSLNASSQNASKPQVLQISEAGVVFRSYRDGRVLELTPESSVEAQKTLGADIIIPLDELPPYHISKSDLMASLERTHRWERRSLDEHLKDTRGQAMYGVIHGGMHFDLRAASVEVLTKLPFDGFAIGGSVGRNLEELVKLLEFVMPKIPPQVPTHLLGIADDLSIEQCVPRGIDTFDSCYPTRGTYVRTLCGLLVLID